jgi:hypothetical protein
MARMKSFENNGSVSPLTFHRTQVLCMFGTIRFLKANKFEEGLARKDQ